MVVICFQILSLTTFLQVYTIYMLQLVSCDLLSNFIFDNVLTSKSLPSKSLLSCDLLSNFIFDNVLTRRRWNVTALLCCDLLSNFIFDNVLTSNIDSVLHCPKLWFAFKFYLWQRSYKYANEECKDCLLWFAFKFYLWQRSYKD